MYISLWLKNKKKYIIIYNMNSLFLIFIFILIVNVIAHLLIINFDKFNLFTNEQGEMTTLHYIVHILLTLIVGYIGISINDDQI